MPPAPITLTSDQIAQVEALAAFLTVEQVADYIGMSRDTFRLIRGRDERVELAWNKGRARMIAEVGSGVVDRARDGDNAAAFYVLGRLGGWKETSSHEHAGPGGGPIQTEDVTTDAEAFARRMAGLAARAAVGGDGPPPTGG